MKVCSISYETVSSFPHGIKVIPSRRFPSSLNRPFGTRTAEIFADDECSMNYVFQFTVTFISPNTFIYNWEQYLSTIAQQKQFPHFRIVHETIRNLIFPDNRNFGENNEKGMARITLYDAVEPTQLTSEAVTLFVCAKL